MQKLRAATLSIMALSIMTLSITTLNRMGLYVTLGITDTKHKQHSAFTTLNSMGLYVTIRITDTKHKQHSARQWSAIMPSFNEALSPTRWQYQSQV
jgi:hypothetical protein